MSDADETRETDAADGTSEANTSAETTTGTPTGDVPRIVASEDVLSGKPRVEGTRIGVHTVYERYARGSTEPTETAVDYDLSVAAVHAALAYAYANIEEIRAIERRTAEMLRSRRTQSR